MEEDGHRRFPRVHNANAHVCKSFQVAIERSKSALVHLWQVLPYIIASLCFAAAFILSCHNAIVLLTPMLLIQLLGCCISCCVFVGLCCYFRCWFQCGFIALVGHMSLLCFAVDSAVFVRFAILEGLLWFVQNIPSVVVVDWTRREYRSDNVGCPAKKIYKLLVLVVAMLSFGRGSIINRRDLGCTLSRLPSQNNAEIDPILDEKTSAVDSSPPWLDICFPSETNEEYASCTVDTAVYNHVAPWHARWLVETEGWTVYVLSAP